MIGACRCGGGRSFVYRGFVHPDIYPQLFRVPSFVGNASPDLAGRGGMWRYVHFCRGLHCC